MSSTRSAQIAQQDVRPRLTLPRLRLALAAIAVGLFGCCATLLSQGPTASNPDNTRPALTHQPRRPTSRPRATSNPTDLRAVNLEAARQQFNTASEQLTRFESTRQSQLDILKSRQADPTQAAAAQQRIAVSATACYEAAARLAHDRQLTHTLEAAQADPSVWSRIPTDALATHADLRRLLTDLKSAQAHTTRLLETRLSAHPAVQSARAAEQVIEASLQQELNKVVPERIAALKSDEQQLASLRDELQRQETSERQLAELAAEYNLYRTNVRSCEAVLRQTEEDLLASRNTHGATHPTNMSVDNAGSVASSIPRTIAADRESETGTTGTQSIGSDNRLLLILVGGLSGLFACLGYFFLNSLRTAAPQLKAVPPVGHVPPQTVEATSSARSTQLSSSDGVEAGVVTSPPAADPRVPADSIGPASVVPPPASSFEPLPVTVCDPRTPRPAGRTTLRDALMRCAERA